MTYLAQEEPNSPKTTDCLNKIDSSSKFLLGILNDILDVSKAEAGKMEFPSNPDTNPIHWTGPKGGKCSDEMDERGEDCLCEEAPRRRACEVPARLEKEEFPEHGEVLGLALRAFRGGRVRSEKSHPAR